MLSSVFAVRACFSDCPLATPRKQKINKREAWQGGQRCTRPSGPIFLTPFLFCRAHVCRLTCVHVVRARPLVTPECSDSLNFPAKRDKFPDHDADPDSCAVEDISYNLHIDFSSSWFPGTRALHIPQVKKVLPAFFAAEASLLDRRQRMPAQSTLQVSG